MMPLASLINTLNTQNRSSLRRLGLLLASAALTAGGFASAQTLVPVPFVTAYAGIPAGSTATQCAATANIPNSVGYNTGDGCLPTQAIFSSLYGAFTDSAGNVYTTENSSAVGANNGIRVIYKGGATLTALLIASNQEIANFTPIPGRIYTVAGGRPSALTVKNGSGKYACDGTTTGISAIDSSGNGCPGYYAYVKPRGMAISSSGDIYFVSTSSGNTVKIVYGGGAQAGALIALENPGVTPQLGYVYTLAGQSTASFNGDGGLAKAAALIVVRDIILDSGGNLYISDGTSTAASGNNIRRIDATTGIITTYAGANSSAAGASNCAAAAATCPAGDTGDGGPATSALLNGPYTIFVDRFDNLFISEYLGNRLRVVYRGGTVGGLTNPVAGNIYTYAGTGTAGTSPDNTLAAAVAFGSVQVSGIDVGGNIYVEDSTAKKLWRFDAATSNGYVVAGRTGTTPANGVSCSGTGTTAPLSTDNFGDGCPAVQASISDIGRVSFDPQGNFYLGESGNVVIRRLSFNNQFPATNVATTATQPLAFKAISAVTLATESLSLQGTPTAEYSDAGNGTCTATSALIAAQVCVFNVNFTPAHDGLRPGALQLSTATAALNTTLLSGDGVASDLAIDPGTKTSAGTGLAPAGVVTDLFGNIYVADQTGNRILKGSTANTTLTPIVTGLKAPAGLALDSLGNLYIADAGNNRILETTSAGATIATVGTGFNAPQGVAVDAFGNVFVADTGNNRLVEIASNGVQTVPASITGLVAPTQLTFDAQGSLYIADTGNSRVVELPFNGNQTAVTLSTGIKPTGVAVDASGTLYVEDATTLQLLSFAPGSSAANTLLTGLVKPAQLAADADANLYLTDTGVSSATYLRRSLGNITFPITNVGQPSTSSINLSNVGNGALAFNTPLYTITGSAAFTLASSTTNGCTAGVSFAAGTGCSFTATFLPTATGPATATVKFNTNATNTAAASALLIGNGQQLVATTSTIAVTSPTGTISYGQPVTITATVTPVSNAGTPTGTVTFTVDNKAQTPLAYGTGTYTLPLNLAVGTHTVSVSFSGDGVYASSSASTSFTVVKASTTTALTVTPVNNSGTVSLTFVATVTSPTATNLTGSVTFYAGSTSIGSIALNTTTKTATYTTSTLNFATNSFTAVYSGDGNFATSTSSATTPTGDFAIASSTTTFTVPQSGVVNLNYAIAPIFNGTGTITPSCTGLPANALCRFTPPVVTLAGVSTSIQMQIYTNVSSTLASNTPAPLAPRTELFLASLLPLGLLAFARRSRHVRALALSCFVLLLTTLPLIGCGSGSPSATQSQGLVTPTGTYTVQVIFTGSAPLGTHTTTLALTVIPNNTTF